MSTFETHCGEGMYRVDFSAMLCGQDIMVCFGGGSLYHIGAAALALPRPSLTGSQRISASASVLCVSGHKDDLLTRQAALQLAAACNCAVSVAGGIHIDQANPDDIIQLEMNFHRALEELKDKLSIRQAKTE